LKGVSAMTNIDSELPRQSSVHRRLDRVGLQGARIHFVFRTALYIVGVDHRARAMEQGRLI
jgi:hypothetical protein